MCRVVEAEDEVTPLRLARIDAARGIGERIEYEVPADPAGGHVASYSHYCIALCLYRGHVQQCPQANRSLTVISSGAHPSTLQNRKLQMLSCLDWECADTWNIDTWSCHQVCGSQALPCGIAAAGK